MLVLACLLMVVGSAMAQGRKVTGVVTDAADGSPLPGVRVFVNKTAVGTVTDARGVFQLTVPNQYNTLTISSVGYSTQEVPVSATMNVKLQLNEKLLDEAIVVAYGKEKKSAFTGSAAEVKSEDIASHVTANAVSAVVGKVAGVQTTSSGGPGSGPGNVRIRGFGSMQASNAPLYIVDGAPTEVGIQNINPQDIESISVLKDAAASAIYGARGANGVIIVTTKRAKAGQPATVTFDAKWGSNSRLIPQYDVIDNPAEYYETHFKSMYNSKIYNGSTATEAYAYANQNIYNQNNGGLGYQVYTVPDGENLIGTNFKLNPHAKLGYTDGEYYYTPDDWYDETFHSSFRQEYNASVSGNEGKLNYFASVGYLKDGGYVDNSNYSRYTSRSNVDYQVNDYIKLSTGMSFTHGDSETPYYTTDTWGSSGNLFYITQQVAPIFPLYVRNADGSIKTENGRVVYDANQTNFTRPGINGNAVRDNAYDRRKAYSDVFTGQWQAVITPIEGLSLTANLNAQSYNRRGTTLYSPYGSGSAVDGEAYVYHDRTLAINQQYLANYTKTFADVHNFSILAGYEQYKVKDQGLTGSNDHLYDPYIGELNNAKGLEQRDPTSSTDNLMREGFLGRVQYDYDNKYFASASIRRDASSKFAPGHRWGTFGSIGAAWQINKEDFMKDVTWVDLLKYKASWGAQGNDGGLGYHAYANRYTTNYNTATGEYTISMSDKGNDELTWETNKEFNTGIEFGLFGNRLNGSIEFYTRKTTDLLYSKTLPGSSGFTVNSYTANVGSMLNYGLEVALDGTILKTKDIQWDANLNFATNHNEITKLDPSIAEGGLKYSNQIIREGGSLYQAYMVKYAGVNKETGKAQYWKAYTWKEGIAEADRNANNPDHLQAMTQTYGAGPIVKEELTEDLTSASRYEIGTTLPDLVGGFGTTVRGWGFDLSAQFAFQLGGKIYDGQYQALMHNGLTAGTAMHKDLLKAWSPENTGSNIPRLSTASTDDPGSGSQTPMDRFLTGASYLALNNITLGYTLPASVVSTLKMKGIRVYVAGENLFVTTKRKGLDPRYNFGIGSMTSGQGRASGDYSSMRSITAGLTLTF